MNWKKLSFLFPLILLTGTVSAESISCEDADSQMAINACMDATYKKADTSLNRTYKNAITRLKSDSTQHKKLVDAQRAWLKFRDAECAFAVGSAGAGSASSMISSECMTSLTEQREKQLHEYLQCPEGDISCPIPN